MLISPGRELCKRGVSAGGMLRIHHLVFEVAALPLDRGSLANLVCRPHIPSPPRQRLTFGLLTTELASGQQTRKVDVLRIDGTGSVVIKLCRKPQLGSPGDVVLDVDVSLRQADVTLGTDECTGLCTLMTAYLIRAEEPTVDINTDVSSVVTKPIKPLFREDFWYFEGSSNNTSGDLNFGTLSSLLEQVIFLSRWKPLFCSSRVS